MTRYSFVAVLVFLSLAFAACGDGGDEGGRPGTTGQPVSSGTPTITGNLFEFPDKGYSVRFPEDWKPLPNFLSGPDFSIDAFFDTQEIEGIQPNMAITCEQLPEGMTLEEYFERKVEVVKQAARVEPEVSSRELAGQDALVSRYARENVESPIEKTEVFFFTEACAWSISLTAPYSQRDNYHDPFEEFLSSFRLLD